MTDELEEQSSGFMKTYQNMRYHALHDGAAEGVGSEYLWDGATFPNPNFQRFGTYLHYLQDTFSHRGFNNPNHGHALVGHKFDKTSSDPARAVRMAKSTWDAMIKFAQTLGCKCNPQWTTEMGNTIVDFAIAPEAKNATRNSEKFYRFRRRFLEGFKTNPRWYMDNKIRILGVPRR